MSRTKTELLPAQRALIREIHTLHARRLPLNISAVKRRHPKLLERVYALRPFWGWKRALEDAGLDYTRINVELRDYVDCKICGQDLGALSAHLSKRHQVTAEDYRLDYPEAELVCETVRAGMSKFASRPGRDAVPHWEPIWSPEYVLDRMAELHRRNYPMNFRWAHRHEERLSGQAVSYFGSWDKALRRIGLDPSQIRLIPPCWPDQRPWWRAGKAAIIAEFHRRSAAGEPVSSKKVQKSKYGCSFLIRARRLFGSWSNALVAAGLDPSGGKKSPWRKVSKAAIVDEIHRRQRAGEALSFKEVQKAKWGAPLVLRATKLFGSWSGALLEAGIAPKHGKSPWPWARKAEVLAELRRRQRVGESLLSDQIVKDVWGAPLLNRCEALFGTYGAALHAAGIEPAKEKSPWVHADEAAIVAEIRRRNRAHQSLRSGVIRDEKWGQPLLARATALFGSWGSALVAAGLEPPPGTTSSWAKASREDILAEIRRRQSVGEPLRAANVARDIGGEPLLNRARALLGSWSEALLSAGIQPARYGPSPWVNASKDDIVRELRRREHAGEPLRISKVGHEKWGKALGSRATFHFGSWHEALLAAGVAPAPVRWGYWATASAEDVLAEIRRRQQAGESLKQRIIARESRGGGLLARAKELFGSWAGALTAAGLKLPPGSRSPWPEASKTAVLAEIQRRARAGETLRVDLIFKEQWGAPLIWRARRLFGSWKAAREAAGITPPPGTTNPWSGAGRAEILAEIRRRDRAGESLVAIDVRGQRWGHTLLERARDLFGSWAGGILAAGVAPPGGLWSPWPKASKADMLAEIKRRHRAGESLSSHRIHDQQWGSALLARAKTLFGSWNAAVAAAGIKAEKGDVRPGVNRSKALTPRVRSKTTSGEPSGKRTSPWLKANRDDILAEIRRRDRAGESLATIDVLRQKWGHIFMKQARRFFGSWTGALLAAGVAPPAGLWGPWPRATQAQVLAELCRRHRAGESLQSQDINTQQWGGSLLTRAKTLFGSWKAALVAAGIEPTKKGPGAGAARSHRGRVAEKLPGAQNGSEWRHTDRRFC